MSLFDAPLNAQVSSNSLKLVLKAMLSESTPSIAIPEATKNASRYLFLDAREVEEYTVSHIRNAVFAGYKNFNLSKLPKIDKEQPIVVYCSIGKRSENITQKLLKAGITDVYNLYGGIFEWVNQGHAVVDNQNRPTNQVHAYSRFWGQWLDKGKKVY